LVAACVQAESAQVDGSGSSGRGRVNAVTRYVRTVPSDALITRVAIPRGYAGTMQTAKRIAALIRRGAADFGVRQHAIDVLVRRNVRPKDYLNEMRALFEWVQRRVRYTKDPYRIELLHAARRMLQLRAGDCDDMAILLGAMLKSIGHPVRLVLCGPDRSRPDLFTHVYLEGFHKGRWIPLDATMPRPMGWRPRAGVRKRYAVDPAPMLAGEAGRPP
jgi:transglutaminase-like putative cysteine protease